MNRQELARRCADVIYQRDNASQALGITILDVAPGSASAMMSVREDMLNGHGICHGGFIFSLADSAFAFACNSYNHNTVASGARIEYLTPARLDDKLTAVATELAASGRAGVYDVTVNNHQGETLALFRGNSRRVSGTLIGDLA